MVAIGMTELQARLLQEADSLSHEQLIQQIQSHNPGASADYLAGFERRSLSLYLARLCRLAGPRETSSVWTRVPDSPAITRAAVLEA